METKLTHCLCHRIRATDRIETQVGGRVVTLDDHQHGGVTQTQHEAIV